MALEISGKVIQILPLETGEGKNGQWKKQFFIMEYMDGNYPKKLCVSVWGDKTDAVRTMQPGSNVKVSFNVDSREYNGRWYTDVRAWRIEAQGAGAAPSNDTPNFDEPAMSGGGSFSNGPDNDLPF